MSIIDLENILLDDHGLYKAVPSAVLAVFDHADLYKFGCKHAVFQFVTTEMLDWIKEKINGVSSLEINAGNGVISRTLGITGIDSRIQDKPEFQQIAKEKYGELMDEMSFTKPPKEIKKYEALEAVRVFRPHTVIGAYVTQKGTIADKLTGVVSNHWGVDERQMLTKIKRYIKFGSITTHGTTRILDLPHEELHFDWLYTRHPDRIQNRVWIWENQ